MDRIRLWAGPLLLAICAACFIAQVLVRPAVGISNNGDFPKLAGPFGIGPEDGTWESHRQYGEFVYRYIRSIRYEYKRDFATAEYLGSGYFLVKIARGLQRMFHPGTRFDIRWLGAVNSAFYLLAIGVWLYALPARWRFLAGVPMVLIWTDVAYVEYMNSFYMDSAALIFLILMVGAGLHAAKKPESRLFPALTVIAAVMFDASKSQHAVHALVLIPWFGWLAIRSRDRIRRATWLAGALLLAAASSAVLSRTTQQYRSTPLFTVIFWRLAPQAPDPLRALQELGLGAGELRYLHTHAYSDNTPLASLEWVRQFAQRCSFPKLLLYYARHPSVPAHFVYQDLSDSATRMVPFGNRSLDDGYFVYAHSAYFTYWSDLRSYLFKHAAWYVIVLALATMAGACGALVFSPADREFAALALLVQLLAVGELGISTLADAAETDRHLFLFHVATEITILLLPALLSKVYTRLRAPATEGAGPIATVSLAQGH